MRKVLTTLVICLGMVLSVSGQSHAVLPAPAGLTPVNWARLSSTTLSFSWKPVSGASEYVLTVRRGATPQLSYTYTAAQAGCPSPTGTCSVSISSAFSPGTWIWALQAKSPSDASPQVSQNFTIADELRTPIYAVPFTISSSGSYFLAGNITLTDATKNGITINADSVTFDLNGYTLTGPGITSGTGNNGIYMNGRKNVEIRNGSVRDFGNYGICEDSDTGDTHRVMDVRAIGNGNTGIRLRGGNHLIQGCSASGNTWTGIYAYGGSLITGCTAKGNLYGIGVYIGSTVTGSTAAENRNDGITANFDGNTISGNTAKQNGNDGIVVYNGSTVIGNTSAYNKGDGLQAGQGNTVKNNTAFANNQNGIKFTSAYNLVDGNTANNNNKSAGAYLNITACPACQWGLNVGAPAP